MDIATKIRVLMAYENIAQAALAKKIDPPMTPQNLSNKMKRNDLRVSEIVAIAEALECDVKITFTRRSTGDEI